LGRREAGPRERGGPGPLRGRGKGRLDWAVGWERAQSEKREVRAEGAWWADWVLDFLGLGYVFLFLIFAISDSNKV